MNLAIEFREVVLLLKFLLNNFPFANTVGSDSLSCPNHSTLRQICIKSHYPDAPPSSPALKLLLSPSYFLFCPYFIKLVSQTNNTQDTQKNPQNVCYNFVAITCWQVKLKMKLTSLICQEKVSVSRNLDLLEVNSVNY